MTVHHNRIAEVGGVPISILGAWDSSVHDNYLDGTADEKGAIIGIQGGKNGDVELQPKNLDIHDNIITGSLPEYHVSSKAPPDSSTLFIDMVRDHIDVRDNVRDGVWTVQTGPKPPSLWGE